MKKKIFFATNVIALASCLTFMNFGTSVYALEDETMSTAVEAELLTTVADPGEEWKVRFNIYRNGNKFKGNLVYE